jgi:hypothetical protein
MRLTGVLAAGALLAGATQASAQGPAPLDTAFAHVNFGGQAGSHTLAQAGTFTIYDEGATFASSTKTKGGAIVDLGGGYRVWHNVYAVLSYAHVGSHSNAGLTGNIPHPLIADRPRPVSGNINGLDHSENQIHLDALLRVPVTTQFDVGVFLGPTIFNVKQDVVSGIEFAEVGKPFDTVTLTRIDTSNASRTGVGFNIGVDGTYMVTQRFGAGVLLRFAGGSVDLPSGENNKVKLDVGGFQFGVGARMRF